MMQPRSIFTSACLAVSFAVTNLNGQAVTLGTWLEDDLAGIHSVSGSGDSFTASPTTIPSVDNGDNFGVRNAERQRVYQLFNEAIDFSSAGDEVEIVFDVTFAGPVKRLDTDFRMSLIDTSTNQGFSPIFWDAGIRAGTYNRARFVDNLDGGSDPFEPHGGAFNDAINGSGTVASQSTAPTENNGATAIGLVDGNTVSFSVLMTREAGDALSFMTNATEAGGDVVYAETAGSYNMVNPINGDTSIRGQAVNSFDGIVFGIFDDDPFSDYSGDHSYTVSNISINSVPEPGNMALLAISWIGFAAMSRKKRWIN